MGAFFTNLHVRSTDAARVIEAVRGARALPAFVSEAADGWVGVYPEATESQDPHVLTSLAAALSRTVGDAIAILVHDSDVFTYWIYRRGELADHYDARPGYFEGVDAPPLGGNAAVLEALRPGQGFAIAQLLRDGTDVTFIEQLTAEFGEAIGIGRTRASFGFNYADEVRDHVEIALIEE